MKELIKITKGPRLNSCFVKVSDKKSDGEQRAQVKLEYGVECKIDDANKEAHLFLNVKSDTSELPFEFDVTIETIFQLDIGNEGFDPADLAIKEGIPLVFPILKEWVADLTRKTYYPPLYIGDINIEGLESKGDDKDKV